jgi:hypothetical protein
MFSASVSNRIFLMFQREIILIFIFLFCLPRHTRGDWLAVAIRLKAFSGFQILGAEGGPLEVPSAFIGQESADFGL